MIFFLLKVGKNLGVILIFFFLGVRDLCRVGFLLGDSGILVGRDLDRGLVGVVFVRGRNIFVDGERVVWGIVVMGGFGGGILVFVNERVFGGFSVLRW